MFRNLRELYQYRGLLLSLMQRELKARYRGSVLGFFWTFLNPTLLMTVYTLIFGLVMRSPIPRFPYFLFVGLLPWTWFSSSVLGSANAISDRRDLLTKVRFPAQVLPANVVATNLVNFLLSIPLMLVLGLFFGDRPTWHVLLFPVIVLVQLCLTLAVSYVVSALNVTFRDLQHLIANLVMVLFFMTPVLYPGETIENAERLPMLARKVLLFGNPMAVLIQGYRRVFYEHRMPDLAALGAVFAASLVLLVLASSLFERRREDFAESV